MGAIEATQASIDEQARAIYLLGQIDEATVQLTLPAVHRFAAESADPIQVHVMSDGGQFSCGLAIYDALRSIGNRIITYAHGDVLSTGVVVFLAGDDRVAFRNSSLMLHRPYSTLTNSNRKGFGEIDTYLAAQEARLERVLAEVGCEAAFGPVAGMRSDVWVHGGNDLLDAGLATMYLRATPYHTPEGQRQTR